MYTKIFLKEPSIIKLYGKIRKNKKELGAIILKNCYHAPVNGLCPRHPNYEKEKSWSAIMLFDNGIPLPADVRSRLKEITTKKIAIVTWPRCCYFVIRRFENIKARDSFIKKDSPNNYWLEDNFLIEEKCQ